MVIKTACALYELCLTYRTADERVCSQLEEHDTQTVYAAAPKMLATHGKFIGNKLTRHNCKHHCILPLRMCPFPTGERVCGEATVDDGQVRLEVGIAQVFVVAPQLLGCEEALPKQHTVHATSAAASAQ